MSQFVCTACGASDFTTKADLNMHWLQRADCRDSLSRPAGQFGARTPGQHCELCTEHSGRADPCDTHAYRGCPGC